MKGREVLKNKKGLFFFVVVLAFCFPQLSLAEEVGTTEAGIGFAGTYQPPKKSPIDNVLPMTNIKSELQGSYPLAQGKLLPKTGEQHAPLLRIVGIFCCMSAFWLFLFNQLWEEEDYD